MRLLSDMAMPILTGKAGMVNKYIEPEKNAPMNFHGRFFKPVINVKTRQYKQSGIDNIRVNW